jgi:hypothetical protein
MGTIIVNGRRFAGNSVAIRDGKVVIDGKVQDGELHGDVDVQAVDMDTGRAECVAAVSAGARAGGGIRAAAFASAEPGLRKRRKR